MNNKGNRAKKNKVLSIVLTLFLDICFASLSFYLAQTIMFFQISPESVPGYLDFRFPIAFASVVITIVMLIIFDCYNVLWKYAGRVEFFKFLFAYLLSFAVIFIFKYILHYVVAVEFWSPLILIYLLFSALLSGSIRFFYGIYHYFKHLRYWVDERSMPNMKRAIVIGAGYTGSLAINRFINNPNEGYYPVAVVDDDVEKQGKRIYGITVEGGLDKIGEIIKSNKADIIVIAIMSLTKSQLKRIYTACTLYNIPIKIMPAIANAGDISNSTLSIRDIKIEDLLGRDEFKVRQELIDGAVKGKVVMVTGGAGSIGSELCRQALAFGCKHLIILDNYENGMFYINEELSRKYDKSRYTLAVATVRERKRLDEVMDEFRPDIIFHAAAYKHVPMMEISATEAIKNNVFGTLNVIQCAMAHNVKKFVLISTDKAVNPSNIMGASKRITEMLIQIYGKKGKMQMAAVRFGNVLGSNGSVIPIFLKQIKEGGPITLTDRNIKRYFMSIPEAVRLVLQTGAFAASGEIFVLDMGEPVYIYDLACDLIRINGLVPEQDIEIKVTGLRPGEKMFEELRYDNESVDKTVHEGVFVNKLENINEKEFGVKLEKLKEKAFSEDIEGTTDTIFELVPSIYRKKGE